MSPFWSLCPRAAVFATQSNASQWPEPPTPLQIVHSLGGSPGTDIAWFLGPPQAAFWSVQPFYRVQTDTQTDHATLATYEARGRIFHPCMRPKKAIVDVVRTPLPWKKIWGAYGAIYTCRPMVVYGLARWLRFSDAWTDRRHAAYWRPINANTLNRLLQYCMSLNDLVWPCWLSRTACKLLL